MVPINNSYRDISYDPNPDFTGRGTELLDLYLEVLGDLSKLNYSIVGLIGIINHISTKL